MPPLSSVATSDFVRFDAQHRKSWHDRVEALEGHHVVEVKPSVLDVADRVSVPAAALPVHSKPERIGDVHQEARDRSVASNVLECAKLAAGTQHTTSLGEHVL